MAPINPSIGPTSDPNYLRYSQPISSVDPDKTAASIFKGIENVFETGVKGMEAYHGVRATETAGEDARAIQDEYIAELKKARDAVPGPGQPGSAPGTAVGGGAGVSATGDVIPQPPAAEVPAGVQAGVGELRDQAQMLTTARANGKISTTHFRARINDLAKSYRAANPGYAHLYDKAIEEVTGVKSANALMGSLIGDLNAAAAAGAGQRDAVERYLLTHMKEVPDGDKWYQMYKAGVKSESEVLRHFFTNMEWDARHRRERSGIGLVGDRLKNLEATDEITATDLVNQRVTNSFNIMDIGVAGPGASPKQINDKIDGWIKGTIPMPTDEEAQGFIPALRNAQGKMRQEVLAELAKPRKDVNGNPMPSQLSVLGKKAYEIVDRQLDATYGQTIRMFESKEYGMGFHNARIITSMMTDTARRMYDDKDIGEYARISKAISDLGPGANTEILRQALTSNLSPGLPERMKNYVLRNIQRAVVPPAEGEDKVSSSEDADRIIRMLGKDGSGPAIALNVDGVAGALMNPKVDRGARIEAATYLFGPKSREFLDKFKTDYVRTDVNGRSVSMPGKYRLYDTLGSPAMSQAIKDLKDPAVTRQYVNWMENSFGNHLLRTEIQDLSELHLPQNVKVYYDNNDKRFGIIVDGNKRS